LPSTNSTWRYMNESCPEAVPRVSRNWPKPSLVIVDRTFHDFR
jgi:hypothetical protein